MEAVPCRRLRGRRGGTASPHIPTDCGEDKSQRGNRCRVEPDRKRGTLLRAVSWAEGDQLCAMCMRRERSPPFPLSNCPRERKTHDRSKKRETNVPLSVRRD